MPSRKLTDRCGDCDAKNTCMVLQRMRRPNSNRTASDGDGHAKLYVLPTSRTRLTRDVETQSDRVLEAV